MMRTEKFWKNWGEVDMLKLVLLFVLTCAHAIRSCCTMCQRRHVCAASMDCISLKEARVFEEEGLASWEEVYISFD